MNLVSIKDYVSDKNLQKNGFWENVEGTHFCSECGAVCSCDALGNEDLIDECQICGSKMLFAAEEDISQRLERLKKIRGVSGSVYENVRDEVERVIKEKCIINYKLVCDCIENNTENIVIDLIQESIEDKFLPIITSETQKFIKKKMKEILNKREDEINDKIIKALFNQTLWRDE